MPFFEASRCAASEPHQVFRIGLLGPAPSESSGKSDNLVSGFNDLPCVLETGVLTGIIGCDESAHSPFFLEQAAVIKPIDSSHPASRAGENRPSRVLGCATRLLSGDPYEGSWA